METFPAPKTKINKSETILSSQIRDLINEEQTRGFNLKSENISKKGYAKLLELGKANIGKDIEFKFLVIPNQHQHSYKLKFTSENTFEFTIFDNESFIAIEKFFGFNHLQSILSTDNLDKQDLTNLVENNLLTSLYNIYNNFGDNETNHKTVDISKIREEFIIYVAKQFLNYSRLIKEHLISSENTQERERVEITNILKEMGIFETETLESFSIIMEKLKGHPFLIDKLAKSCVENIISFEADVTIAEDSMAGTGKFSPFVAVKPEILIESSINDLCTSIENESNIRNNFSTPTKIYIDGKLTNPQDQIGFIPKVLPSKFVIPNSPYPYK
jgi:hypothetical protein